MNLKDVLRSNTKGDTKFILTASERQNFYYFENSGRKPITASHDYVFALNFYYNEFVKS